MVLYLILYHSCINLYIIHWTFQTEAPTNALLDFSSQDAQRQSDARPALRRTIHQNMVHGEDPNQKVSTETSKRKYRGNRQLTFLDLKDFLLFPDYWRISSTKLHFTLWCLWWIAGVHCQLRLVGLANGFAWRGLYHGAWLLKGESPVTCVVQRYEDQMPWESNGQSPRDLQLEHQIPKRSWP